MLQYEMEITVIKQNNGFSYLTGLYVGQDI